MKKILLCTSNPLLVKSLYGLLRDAGFAVEDVEHPSLAVHKVLGGAYDCTIIDAEPFGLSAEDAAQIIGSLAPGMPIFCVGSWPRSDNLPLIELPADLAAIREMMHLIAV